MIWDPLERSEIGEDEVRRLEKAEQAELDEDFPEWEPTMDL